MGERVVFCYCKKKKFRRASENFVDVKSHVRVFQTFQNIFKNKAVRSACVDGVRFRLQLLENKIDRTFEILPSAVVLKSTLQDHL